MLLGPAFQWFAFGAQNVALRRDVEFGSDRGGRTRNGLLDHRRRFSALTLRGRQIEPLIAAP